MQRTHPPLQTWDIFCRVIDNYGAAGVCWRLARQLVRAHGNNAKIGGLKVVTENAWFAARPSGTEDVYKIYGESFKGAEHLAQVQEEAKAVVAAALNG